MSDFKKFKHLWLFSFLADYLAVIAAYVITYVVRFHVGWGVQFFTCINRFLDVRATGELGERFERFYFESAPRIVIILTATICVLYSLLGLYSGRRFIRKRSTAWNIVVANVIALAFFYAYFYLSRNIFHPRSFFATIIFLNSILAISFRNIAGRVLTHLRARLAMDRQYTILIGNGRNADYIRSIVDVLHPHGMDIVGRINGGTPFNELVRNIERMVEEKNADALIVADMALNIDEIMQLLEISDKYDLSVKVLSDKMDVLMNQARLPVDMIHGTPLVHFDAPSERAWNERVTRPMSLLSAVVILIILSPLMALIAMFIKITSAGPVLFIQERIGVNRRPFKMLKFRTMYDGAEEARAQLEEFNESNGALFKIKNDPRITPVGRLLRRFSLDELPQLWNVIIGDMKIVGPRPLPTRDFASYYETWHYSRHGGLPGLTCLWQISGRSEIDFHNMCLLDIYYLRNHSWVLDFKIFIKTIWVVMFGRGAY